MNKKKPKYAQIKYQLKERTEQADQYHKNWISQMAETNKFKHELNQKFDEIKSLFVEKETLRLCLIELLKQK